MRKGSGSVTTSGTYPCILCTRPTRSRVFFNRASSIKQESIGKHIYPFGHISLLAPNQPLCAFTLLFGVPGREAANTRLCCYVFHPLHRGECAMLTRRYNGYD
jgi:hypothetical protein